MTEPEPEWVSWLFQYFKLIPVHFPNLSKSQDILPDFLWRENIFFYHKSISLKNQIIDEHINQFESLVTKAAAATFYKPRT